MSKMKQAIGRIAAVRADGYGIIVQHRKKPGEGWFSAGELDPGGRVAAILLSRIIGIDGPPPDHIRAEWLLESLARAVADLGGSFILATGAIPDLSPGRVLLAAEGGLFRATAVTSDDLFAGDLPDLADRFRDGYIELLGPTVDWLSRQGLRPAKTLWHAAADRLAQSLDWSGRAFDQAGPARELARLTVGPETPDPRLAIRLDRAEDEYGDDYHLRNTCCLAYRTPGGDTCRSCPLNHKKTA